MLGINTEDKPIALASALTYWVFRCRDKQRSPANGIKTWEYVQTSIENAAIPSRNLNDYIHYLSKRLVVPTLKPKEWTRLVQPQQVILRAAKAEDGNVGEIQQIDSDQSLVWESWEDIIKRWSIQFGITDRAVLRQCLEKSQIVALYVRLKHEEDKALWLNKQEDEDVIDV